MKWDGLSEPGAKFSAQAQANVIASRGSSDVPGFQICVEAEMKSLMLARIAELEAQIAAAGGQSGTIIDIKGEKFAVSNRTASYIKELEAENARLRSEREWRFFAWAKNKHGQHIFIHPKLLNRRGHAQPLMVMDDKGVTLVSFGEMAAFIFPGSCDEAMRALERLLPLPSPPSAQPKVGGEE